MQTDNTNSNAEKVKQDQQAKTPGTFELGPLKFNYDAEGRLRLAYVPPTGGQAWGLFIKATGQERLIDFLLHGYKENMHKEAERGDTVDRIWEKVSDLIKDGKITPGARYRASYTTESFVNKEAADAMADTENEFRKACIDGATKMIKEGNIAQAAKIMEMYETI